MRLLYLDTSSSFLYSAIIFDKKIVSSISEKLNNNLSSLTLPKIEEMFEKANLNIDDIDKIIAVNGPGSFTGIRIGLTIAKTIAWAKNIPIVPLSSLEAMALSGSHYDYIVPAIDARRNYLYASIFDVKNNNFVMNEKYISCETLDIALSNISGSICFVSNDNINTNYDVQPYEPDFVKICEYVDDREPVNPHSVDANYLKLTEAEESLGEKYD